MNNNCTCTRCGQIIKNITVIDGKPYGNDCAAEILGMRDLPSWFQGGDWNKAKAEHDAKTAVQVSSFEAKKQDLRNNWEWIKEYAEAYRNARKARNEFASNFLQDIAVRLGIYYTIEAAVNYTDADTYMIEENKKHYGQEVPEMIKTIDTLSPKQQAVLIKLLNQFK